MADVVRPQVWDVESDAEGAPTAADVHAKNIDVTSPAPAIGLSESELEELVKRLLVYAKSLLSRRVWRGEYGGTPPGAITPEDLVQTAFTKFLSGKRRHTKDATHFSFFAGIIQSEISHQLDTPENRHAHASLQEGFAAKTISASVIPDNVHASVEDMLLAGDWLRRVHQRFGSDHLVMRYAMLLAREQLDTATEYAEVLGVSEDDIFNMNKRLRRFLKRIRGGQDG